MSSRAGTILYRIALGAALLASVVSGALLAVQGHTAPRRLPPLRPHTIVAPSPTGGRPVPVATVVPPARDAGVRADAAVARTFPWPAPLINPAGHLGMAWELALGRPNSREVLFTFDDGPNPGTTDRLLNILDRAHIKAVFFVCGWRMITAEEPLRTRARAILQDAHRRGHVIGNHTVNHRDLATLTPEQVRSEIERNADVINEVIGVRPYLFRPPYGSYSQDVRAHVESKHYELSLWSVDSHDWQMVGDAQRVAMNVIRLLGNMAGGTVLMHDTHPWSVSAAQMVFRWLEQENRERTERGRPVYRVLDAAEYFDGMRARLPIIEAERAAAARNAPRSRRGADAGAVASADAAAPADAAAATATANARTTPPAADAATAAPAPPAANRR